MNQPLQSRLWIAWLLIGTISVGRAARVEAAAPASERPNILFIMADDHTWQALGCYHSRLCVLNPTPTLDQLAAEGMIFDNALCTNSICTPSRACIITGQYSHVNGALTLNGRIPKERQYLAIEMKNAGYQTAMIGKWHLKERPAAFDYYKVLPGQGKYFDPEFYQSGKSGKVTMKGHCSDCITDSALTWLADVRRPGRPFFFMLHFKAPHDYFQYAPRYENYLADVNIPEPASLWQRGSGSIATRGYHGELEHVIATSIGRRNFRRSYVADWGLPDTLTDAQAKRAAYNIYLKKYLRCVKGVDDNLKRVFKYLRDNGLMDNTVIMYTGDQGMFLGEHDMQDKRWAYEPSYRMPLLVRYPKTITAGSRSDALVENVDFPVTMLDYAGVRRPAYMQGRSFRAILDTGVEPKSWKKEGYYQYWMHMAHHDVPAHIGMRTKRYMLILFYGTAGTTPFRSERSKYATPPAWELYDLRKDPDEMTNVYDDPAYASVVRDLKARFHDLRHRVRADDPSAGVDQATRARMAACNAVIDEFWDYSAADREKAIQISHDYFRRFGDPEKCVKYKTPLHGPNRRAPHKK